MKIRLFSAAVAALMATASMYASATNVELYGIVDYGMSIQNRSYVGQDSTTTTALKSGQYNGSRWGIRGTEELGNGLKVGFVLENGFDADTGAMKSGRLFGRDARLFVEGAFGQAVWVQKLAVRVLMLALVAGSIPSPAVGVMWVAPCK